MKTSQDPRHQKRMTLVQELFAASFPPQDPSEAILPVIEHLNSIDEHITKAAPEWPLDKISKIDLAILRLAVYELSVEKKEPPKVVIDEAVELAKTFGNATSPGFINGALGTVLKNL